VTEVSKILEGMLLLYRRFKRVLKFLTLHLQHFYLVGPASSSMFDAIPEETLDQSRDFMKLQPQRNFLFFENQPVNYMNVNGLP